MTDWPKASRTTDPLSSHVAEAEINATGGRESQAKLVLSILREHPGCTAKELTHFAPHHVDRYTFSRRLPDLEKANKVERGPIRKCRVGKRLSVTWYPTPKPLELF